MLGGQDIIVVAPL